ncbi:VanZ family protein [Burkholderiaceae bacterium UC74_6]
MNSTSLLRLSRLCFFVLLVVISWLAFTPHPPPQADLGWDKLNHFSAFSTLMVFAAWSWPQHWRRAPLGLLTYGGFIEIVQSFIPGRDGEWADLLADAIGIALGVALFALVLRPLHKHFANRP